MPEMPSDPTAPGNRDVPSLVLVREFSDRTRGKEEGLRIALETVLTSRFGAVPAEIAAAVAAAVAAADAAALDAWLRRASTAERLQDVGIASGEQAGP